MSCTGSVKCFNPVKGFGFITVDGTDIFVHMSACSGGVPKEGDTVTFDMEDSPKKPGQKQAANVVGGTGAMKGVMGSGTYKGTVKRFNPMKGFGFITYDGGDVFVHIRDCQGGCPQQGDTVAFEMEDSTLKPGCKQATQVTGGTGDLNPGGGKGDDWGMGGMMGMMNMMGGGKGKGGYGPMWGGKGMGGKGMMGSSPYGGGMGMGGGKGMGGWGGGKGMGMQSQGWGW